MFAVYLIIKSYNLDLNQKKVLLIGRNYTLSNPLSILLQKMNAICTIIPRNSDNIEEYVKNSDIIISSLKNKNKINFEWFRDNSIYIDCDWFKKDKIIDISHLKLYSPNFNGLGPLMTSILMRNLFICWKKNNNIRI